MSDPFDQGPKFEESLREYIKGLTKGYLELLRKVSYGKETTKDITEGMETYSINYMIKTMEHDKRFKLEPPTYPMEITNLLSGIVGYRAALDTHPDTKKGDVERLDQQALQDALKTFKQENTLKQGSRPQKP